MKKERLYIRLSLEEKLKLVQRARLTGTTLSDFLRKMVLEKEINFLSPEDKNEIIELKKELRIATNFRNQNKTARDLIDPIRKKVKDFIKKLT